MACLALVQAIPMAVNGQTATPAPGTVSAPAQTTPSAGVQAQPMYPAQPQPMSGAPAPAAAPAPAPVPAPHGAPPATPAPQFVVPPGYMLVPTGSQIPPADSESRNALALAREEEMINAYQEGDPVPAGYRAIREQRRGLVIAGSIVGGISYGFSVVGAIGADFEDKSSALMIPVFGPWIMLAMGGGKDRPCEDPIDYVGSSHCGERSGLRAALALDGLTQAAGAIMLTVGLAHPRTRLVRKNFELAMSPIPLGRDGYGLGALGRF